MGKQRNKETTQVKSNQIKFKFKFKGYTYKHTYTLTVSYSFPSLSRIIFYMSSAAVMSGIGSPAKGFHSSLLKKLSQPVNQSVNQPVNQAVSQLGSHSFN